MAKQATLAAISEKYSRPTLKLCANCGGRHDTIDVCILSPLMHLVGERKGKMSKRAKRRAMSRVDAHALWDDLVLILDKLERGEYDEQRTTPKVEQEPVVWDDRAAKRAYMLWSTSGVSRPPISRALSHYIARRMSDASGFIGPRAARVFGARQVRALKRVVLAEMARESEFHNDPISVSCGLSCHYDYAPVRTRLRKALDALGITEANALYLLDQYTEIECSHTSYGQTPNSHYVASYIRDVFSAEAMR